MEPVDETLTIEKGDFMKTIYDRLPVEDAKADETRSLRMFEFEVWFQ